MKLTLSGKTYDSFISPKTSSVLAEIGVTTQPTAERHGNGVSWTFDLPERQARQLLDVLDDWLEALSQGGIDSDAGERAALRRDARRLREALERSWDGLTDADAAANEATWND